ncbi:MAG TPA: (2Fe-2S)-binding protein [Caulifigura sp.]|jgi:bacterioferritin-associated ferredoxin|nr:(2Fe-2S)-binding protein [Caulifigura sp.]
MTATTVAANPTVCRCFGIRESQIRDAVAVYGCETVKEVSASTDAGRGCTVCHCKIRQMIAEYQRERTAAAADTDCPSAA